MKPKKEGIKFSKFFIKKIFLIELKNKKSKKRISKKFE